MCICCGLVIRCMTHCAFNVVNNTYSVAIDTTIFMVILVRNITKTLTLLFGVGA